MKDQKGITLIALIITIIVMLILVGVTISVSLDGGLFTTAKEAKGETQIAQEKEQLLMVVMGALGENGKVNPEKIKLPEGFTENNGVYTSKSGNKFIISEFGSVTLVHEGGTTVKVWTQDGITVTDGSTLLNVGAIVTNYTAGNKTWQILGAEGGKLLLTTSTILGSKKLVATQADWNDIDKKFTGLETALDNECVTLIGNKGKAEIIRSITVEDINRVTGYDPSEDTTANFYNEEPITIVTGTLPNGKNSIQVTSTHYNCIATNTKNYVANNPAYLMIFGSNSNKYSYWLASTVIFAPEQEAIGIGLRYVNQDMIMDGDTLGFGLWNNSSGANVTGMTKSVRPVAVMPDSFVPTTSY